MSPAWLFILLLAVPLGCVALEIVWRAGGKKAPVGGTVSVAALAVMLLGASAIETGKTVAGPTRVSLEALEFAPDGAQEVSLGGDAAYDEIVVPDTPRHLLSLRRDDEAGVNLAFSPSADPETLSLVLLDDAPLQGMLVREGTSFCLEPCSEEQTFRYSEARKALVSQGEIGAPFASRQRPFSRTPEVYPIRRHAPADIDAGEVAGVFYRARSGQLFWAPLDQRVRVLDGASAPISARLCLDEAQCLREAEVSVISLNLEASNPTRRWAERRSFDMALVETGELRIVFDTPTTHDLRAQDLRLEQDRLTQLGIEPAIHLASAAGGSFQTSSTVSILSFGSIGGAFAGVGYDLLYTRSPIALARQSSEVVVPNGGAVTLGSAHRINLRLTELNGEWRTLWAAQLVFIIGGFAALFATLRLRRSSHPAFALFLALEVLLALRLLVAIESAYVDPGRSAQEAPAQAMAALLIAPLILSLCFRSTLATPIRLILHAGVVLLGCLWIERNAGGLGLLWLLLAATLVAATALAAIALVESRLMREERPSLFGLWRGLERLGADPANGSTVPWLILLFLLALSRLGLAFVGFQESIELAGSRLSLSILYVPLALLFFGGVLARWSAADPERPLLASTLAFLLAVASIYGITAAPLINDYGAAIYGLPVLLMAGVVAARASGRSRTERMALAAPAALAALLFVFVNASAPASEALNNRIPAAETDAERIEALTRSENLEGVRLRVLTMINPAEVQTAGTLETEGISATMANLADHTRLVVGPGFLRASAPIGLLPFHMNDNAPAVHLIGPFGRASGAAVVALLFAALVLLWMPGLGGARFDRTRWQWGAMAFGTLVLVSTYMIMANSLSAPLTGRNVYLMSVVSIGDFVEAMALFCIAALGLGEGEGEE